MIAQKSNNVVSRKWQPSLRPMDSLLFGSFFFSAVSQPDGSSSVSLCSYLIIFKKKKGIKGCEWINGSEWNKVTVCRLGCPLCSSFTSAVATNAHFRIESCSCQLRTDHSCVVRKFLLIHLASLLSQKQRNKKKHFQPPFFSLWQNWWATAARKKEKKRRWQFPSQPPLTEKQRVTQEAFLSREEISISPLTGFGKSWIKPGGTSQLS